MGGMRRCVLTFLRKLVSDSAVLTSAECSFHLCGAKTLLSPPLRDHCCHGLPLPEDCLRCLARGNQSRVERVWLGEEVCFGGFPTVEVRRFRRPSQPDETEASEERHEERRRSSSGLTLSRFGKHLHQTFEQNTTQHIVRDLSGGLVIDLD